MPSIVLQFLTSQPRAPLHLSNHISQGLLRVMGQCKSPFTLMKQDRKKNEDIQLSPHQVSRLQPPLLRIQTNLLFYSHVGQIQHEDAGLHLKSHKNEHTIQSVHNRYTELLNLQMPSSWHKNSRTNWHLPAFWQIPTGIWLIQIHPNYSSVIRMTGRCHGTLSVHTLLCKTNVFLCCHLIDYF